MMKRIITLALLLVCSTVWMMALDVVRLTDGRVIKGHVVTQVAGESVTIENLDGVVITYPSYLVKSVTIGEVRDVAQDNTECRGFRALVDAVSELKGLEAYEEFAALVEKVFTEACK